MLICCSFSEGDVWTSGVSIFLDGVNSSFSSCSLLILAALKDIILKNIYSPHSNNSTILAIVGAPNLLLLPLVFPLHRLKYLSEQKLL